jgi:rSAM/selenodomain-associated transferase 1
MPIPPQDTVIAIFVRHPIPGRVKTRLARDLGDEAACDLYRAMVADSIASVRTCGLPLFLFHDGQDRAGLPPEWIGAANTVFRQEGESLGERMNAAFEQSFSTGSTGVILIGSDIPGIDAGLLRSALESIEEHDAVFAPAFDGGYCLAASKKDCFNSRIFQGIPWSTSRVLDMTIAACTAYGVSYHLLEPRQDIDTMEDLAAYCRIPSESAPTTNAWLVSQRLLEPL